MHLGLEVPQPSMRGVRHSHRRRDSMGGRSRSRYSSEISVFNGYMSTPPPNYTDYEYQWLAFGNSDPNAQHAQGSTTTSTACDSPVQPGGSSCTVTCSWNFNKQ